MTDETRDLLLAKLKNLYTYDPSAGCIVNRRTGRAVKGNKHRNGYLYLDLRLGGNRYGLQYHRCVWALARGRFPPGQTDHLNGDRADNRIGNLREVTASENKTNTLLPLKVNRRSGLPGVYTLGGGFCKKLGGKRFFGDRYMLFFWAVMTGHRYKQVKE